MKLYKSTNDRIIMGICGGLSQSFGFNVKVVRLVCAVLIVASFSIVLWIYLIIGLLLPFDEDVKSDSRSRMQKPFATKNSERQLTDKQRRRIEQNERDTYYRPPDKDR